MRILNNKSATYYSGDCDFSISRQRQQISQNSMLQGLLQFFQCAIELDIKLFPPLEAVSPHHDPLVLPSIHF